MSTGEERKEGKKADLYVPMVLHSITDQTSPSACAGLLSRCVYTQLCSKRKQQELQSGFFSFFGGVHVSNFHFMAPTYVIFLKLTEDCECSHDKV